MPSEDEIVRALSVLTRRTVEKTLNWRLSSPPAAVGGGTNDPVPLYFEARFHDRTVGLYLRRRSGPHDDEPAAKAFVLLDADGRPLWEYQGPSPALDDLFVAARESVAKVDDFIADVLSGSA